MVSCCRVNNSSSLEGSAALIYLVAIGSRKDSYRLLYRENRKKDIEPDTMGFCLVVNVRGRRFLVSQKKKRRKKKQLSPLTGAERNTP
jgi:hypothetical protein